jgi:ABC-type nitrate/sulfonate/bicarbonate transport system ATPase subunit
MRAVIVTHDLREAVRMAGRVLILGHGFAFKSLDLSRHSFPRPPAWEGSREESEAVRTLELLLQKSSAVPASEDADHMP